MIDSGAAISVAPKEQFSHVELNTRDSKGYNLQSAKGDRLRIHGTREVPLIFGKHTINIKVIVCDVTLPLLSVHDLIRNGLSIILEQHNPVVIHDSVKYPLKYENKHFWLKRLMIKKGINVIAQDGLGYEKS